MEEQAFLLMIRRTVQEYFGIFYLTFYNKKKIVINEHKHSVSSLSGIKPKNSTVPLATIPVERDSTSFSVVKLCQLM